MSYTALHEFYGGGVDRTVVTSGIGLPPPSGAPGCRRVHLLRPAGDALVILPSAAHVRLGEWLTVINAGPANLFLYTASGTLIGVVPPGLVITGYLVSADPEAWAAKVKFAAGLSAALLTDRAEFDLTLPSGANLNIRTLVDQAFRYDGTKPATVLARLPAGGLIGSASTSTEALVTGSWPAGSTILLSVAAGSWIIGRGGSGGRGGGGGLLPQPGGPGGPALGIQCTTALVNRGTIGGGGGGGGGGAAGGTGGSANGENKGGGGGGGAGWVASTGGNVGIGGLPAGIGQPGIVETPGAGGLAPGATPGGTGGALGAAGGGSSGGAAGNAIVRLSAFTLTKILAGTISGAEVAV